LNTRADYIELMAEQRLSTIACMPLKSAAVAYQVDY